MLAWSPCILICTEKEGVQGRVDEVHLWHRLIDESWGLMDRLVMLRYENMKKEARRSEKVMNSWSFHERRWDKIGGKKVMEIEWQRTSIREIYRKSYFEKISSILSSIQISFKLRVILWIYRSLTNCLSKLSIGLIPVSPQAMSGGRSVSTLQGCVMKNC